MAKYIIFPNPKPNKLFSSSLPRSSVVSFPLPSIMNKHLLAFSVCIRHKGPLSLFHHCPELLFKPTVYLFPPISQRDPKYLGAQCVSLTCFTGNKSAVSICKTYLSAFVKPTSNNKDRSQTLQNVTRKSRVKQGISDKNLDDCTE